MRLRDSQSWISKTLEASYNTPEPTGSNYSFIPTLNPYFTLPVVEKVNDGQRIGRNAASHLCNTYWSHFEVAINDDVETDVPARLFRRALGGAVIDTLVPTAAATWDHTFAMLNPQIGVNLPSFSVPVLLGDASFLFAGCRVDRFKVMQSNNERVTYEADVVGSGKFTQPHGLVGLPALATIPCMDGFRTEVSYVHPVFGLINLGTLGTLMEWSVELQNNLRRNRRRVGDPIQIVGNGAAAHVRNMPLGSERNTVIALKMDFVDLDEWTAMTENVKLEDLIFKVSGPITEGAFRHEFEIVVPSFAFEVVTPDEDEGDAAISINVLPFEDTVSKGTITGRVRNNQATLV